MDMLHGTNIHLENKSKSKHFFIYIWIMYATVYMTRNCFNAAMANIVADGVLTKSQTGLITALFYIVYAPLQIPGGMLADKYNPERLAQIGLLGGAAANVVIFFNHSYFVILITWVLNAIVQAPLWPAVFKIISSQLAHKDRRMMVFVLSFTNTVGLLMGYVLAAFIPSWEYNFAISAVLLVILAILMYEMCMYYGSYTYAATPKQEKEHTAQSDTTSTWRLFAASGFLMLLPSIMLRTMVELGAKTLSPTMLMESYAHISPRIGNLLNIFVIISGLVGTLLIKLVLYPRFIKNEMTGICVMLVAALPFTVVLKFVGVIPIPGAVIALCGLTAATVATHLLLSYYNMCFAPYGKNATAAGLSNAAASLGVVFESYGFLRIADIFGWNAVTSLWIVMIAVAILFTAAGIPLLKRFKRGMPS